VSAVSRTIRLATPADIPALTELIGASVHGLQWRDYTPPQIDGALRAVYGVDAQLIADGEALDIVRMEKNLCENCVPG
jgi:hypothetical protein